MRKVMSSLKVLWVSTLVCLLCFGALWVPASWARVDEIRIADSKGDWGYPNPYGHYPRGPGYVRMSWVFETLVWKNDRGYVPALAKSWAYDPDRTAFVFHLQEGVTWHDGQPFTAYDVVFTVNYFKKHPYKWVPTDAVAGAEAPDVTTVVIRLSRP